MVGEALSIWRNSIHFSNPVLSMYNTLLVVYGKHQERRRLRANEHITTVTMPGLATIQDDQNPLPWIGEEEPSVETGAESYARKCFWCGAIR